MAIEGTASDNCTNTAPIIVNGQSTPSDDVQTVDERKKQHQPRKGHNFHDTSISSARSYGQRDSRLHSIYDQYLYQNSESVDLPLQNSQSLTAKKSIRIQHSALESVDEMSSSSSRYQQQHQAQATRHHMQAPSGGRTNRDSQADASAWAGMMTGNVVDDSDSDMSDDERVRVPMPHARGQQPPPSGAVGSRNSWSSRAAAVGSRPPDSASQNPPTLKLLGLKSMKEGGAPLVPQDSASSYSSRHASSRQQDEERRSRIVSTSDYGDELDRHDSFIEEFDGARNQPLSNVHADRAYPNPSSLHPPSSENRPVSPRTALTQQLGLVTPQASSPHHAPATQQYGQERGRNQPDGYFPPMISPSSSGGSSSNISQQRSLVSHGSQPGQQRQQRPQQDQQRQQQQQRAPPPPALTIPNGSQAIPLQRTQLSPAYPPSSPGFAPLPSPSSSTPPRGGGPIPMPIPLPSPVYAQNPATRPQNGQYAQGDARPRGGAAPPPGPGFSDTPQAGGRQVMRRQPSLLRRSMAFITGSGPVPPMNQQYPQQGAPPPRQGNAGNGQRRSLFRRSMAFLSGRPGPAMMPEPQRAQPVDLQDDARAPQPRVAGFVEEKPRSRKSEYLGGGAVGDEWDYAGVGAKFWRRFSMAQRKELEGANKDSEQFRRKTEKRRRWIMYMSLLGGVCIIGAVIGIVIWRENVKTSDTPGALNRQNNGVYTVYGSTETSDANVNAVASATPAASTRSTSTSRRHRTSTANNRRREIALATSSPVVAGVIRDLASGAPAYYGGVHPLPRDGQLPSRALRKRRRSAQTTPAPVA